VLTCERFRVAINELAGTIIADGFRPDIVLAVARGGLPVAGALAYALDVKNCFTMNVAFYTGIDERLEVPVVLPPTLDKVDVTGARVLVADDVADTGKTLELVQREVAEFVADARSAVLYLKPWSVVIPEYAWAETDRWIDFPWSTATPPPR
jgi:hypoxanthine phosphoribosyltransferase